MDPSEFDAIVQRLVADPHDEEALAYAHHAGQSDPKAYAVLLERVGNETQDPAYASHWLSEAANVWLTALGDAHRAARVLMTAIDRDPTQQTAADRLAQLYRDKGDAKALAALLDRRAKALTPLLGQSPELRGEVAAMHEELGRLWSDAPLSQPRKAVDHFKRAFEIDPSSALAIYSARELLKAQGQVEEACQLYEPELAVEQDPQRRVAILRDEAATRKSAGDLPGAARALDRARQLDDQEPGLQQEYAAVVLERAQGGENVPQNERAVAAELLVGLAEVYDGEHGLAYSSGALDLEPGHERAMQLFSYYARTLQREDDLPTRYVAYLGANPSGSMSAEARHYLAASYVAAGQPEHAAAILEPLAAAGDQEALAKLAELGAPAPAPRRPSGHLPAQPGPPADRPSWGAPSPGTQEGSTRPAPLPADRVQAALDAGQMLAGKGKKAEAYAKYKEVLEADAAHAEALAWVEDYLRSKRDYGALRDVLLASVRATSGAREAQETRKERLREVAGLCEGNLRDVDGAVGAYKQLLAIDRTDDSARQALTRLLEKSSRWDDLANLLEQEATSALDVDNKIALEKKLAKLHEDKRRDPGAAAEAWARIAQLTPEDDRAISTASDLFEKANQLEQAAQVLGDHATSIEDPPTRGKLLERLGGLRGKLADHAGAGDAYADAAKALESAALWESAERSFGAAELWERAAAAACERASLAGAPKAEAEHLARAADLFARAERPDEAVAKLERACELDPDVDDYSAKLVLRYGEAELADKVAAHLVLRSGRVTGAEKRVALRREAAQLFASRLDDHDAAREQWLKLLEDGEDREALEQLVDYAVQKEDFAEATTLLRRLGGAVTEKADKARVALREAELLADRLGDVDGAIARYEGVLSELDPACRPALQAIADLEEARDNVPGAAAALERELAVLTDAGERGPVAGRLAGLYERVDDAPKAIRALDIVREADPDDFEALDRLRALCVKTEQWGRVAELLAQRIEIEGDEDEAASMTLELSEVLADRLDRGDEALAALTELADGGHQNLRDAYVKLGDRLGWKGIVAAKLVEWWLEARGGPERTAALRGAFDRFCEVGRDQDAVRVAAEVVRAKGGDHPLAERLEQLAVKLGDQDALSLAQDLLARDLTGLARATELVRQAEVRAGAGVPRAEAVSHGEATLGGLALAEAEPLLERLAKLAESPAEIVELYERQVSRTKAQPDRNRALGRAAQVAGAHDLLDRARAFFELALSGVPSEETLALLEEQAARGDEEAGGDKLRRALCQALTTSGGGARDGGRTRASLLLRAARLASEALRDVDQAFAWMGEALVAYVDASGLDALEALADAVGDPRRAEGAISHALGEVFDGPLVRQLLARRAKIRLEKLGDKAGAAADLKKLHDLSPTDSAVLDQLSALLGELGDYRAMVQLYEDQILRGKDVGTRAELARKVARMWEEQLADPREAADAWRRVLRMKAADPEATAGLERAKSNMLKKPDPDASGQYAPPPAPALAERPSERPSVAPPPPPPSATRTDLGPSTSQYVAALTTDTSETPVESPASSGDATEAHGPDTTPPPGARDTATMAAPMTPGDPGMNPAVSPDQSARIELGDIDLVVDEPGTDLGAAKEPLDETSERRALEFSDDEHTEYRPFVPPPETSTTGEDDVVVVDDEAEDVDDDGAGGPAPH